MSTLLADPATARDRAVRALAVLEPFGPTRELALAHSTLGSQDALQARFDEAVSRLDTALELARRTGADDVVAHALNYRGVSLASLGDEAGLADLRESVELARALGHADYATVAAHNLAVVLLRSARIAEAEPYLELGAAVAREHRLETAAYRIEAQQCYVLILRGRWDEAERRLRALLDAGDEPGANAVNPLAFLGRLLARRGDPAAAGFVERAWAAGRRHRRGPEELGGGGGADRVAVADRRHRRGSGPRAAGCSRSRSAPSTRSCAPRCCATGAGPASGSSRSPAARPPFAAGLEGDWATAAELWERAGNPYEQALELTEAPDPRAGPGRPGHAGPAGRGGRGRGLPAPAAAGRRRRCRAGRGPRPGPTRAG